MRVHRKKIGLIKFLGIPIWIKFFKNPEQARVWAKYRGKGNHGR